MKINKVLKTTKAVIFLLLIAAASFAMTNNKNDKSPANHKSENSSENLSSFADEAEQVPAFPGAEGYGAFAKGGRGGQVIQVTNLLDYIPGKDELIPGSLRAAIEQKGPRIIVFRVAGTIHLKAILDINEPFCTIAGQSAPGGQALRVITSVMDEVMDVDDRWRNLDDYVEQTLQLGSQILGLEQEIPYRLT